MVTRRHVAARDSGERYDDVTCAGCGRDLEPVFADHAFDDAGRWRTLQVDGGLHVKFEGGYGEFIDQDSSDDVDDCHQLLCQPCAIRFCDALEAAGFGAFKDTVFRHLSINVGHVCDARGGEKVWEPQPECTADPDRHGWRTVYSVVRQDTSGARGTTVAVYDTWDEADDHAAGDDSLVVHAGPCGNLRYATFEDDGDDASS